MNTKAIVIALMCGSAAAWAQPAPDAPQTEPTPTPVDQATADQQAAKAHFTEGQKHFTADEFFLAAQEFELAYKLDPDPVYLYNIAQAYRRGSACARAADYYRKFLVVVPNPPNLDKVNRYLTELDACAKVEASGQPAPPPKEEPKVEAPAPPTMIADPTAGRFERRLGLAIGAAGVAILGVGVWFTHDVHTLEGYSDALCPPASMAPCAWSASKQARADDLKHRGDRASALEIGGYALGGAAVLSGVVLYVLGDRVPREHPVEVMPAAGGASVSTRFSF